MAENKKSVFNKLNDLLLFKGGFEGTFENKEEKVIIKGDSYQDVLKKQIELQQQEQLYSQFYKVEKNQLQRTMQYEAQRLPAFMDYEGMEYYPMIAAALDLYAEEATTIGENGKMLNIYSKSDRVKKVLEDLFYDVININSNLVSWTRTMCKYGDNMIYLLPEKGKGITMVKQLPVFEMERKEDVINNKLKVWFKRRDTGQEFTPMEIAHFRLAGDDKYYPYGSSILNKGRRTWRQCLDENTEIWTPNGSKKIKNIEIGDEIFSFNTDDEKYFKSIVKNKSFNGIKDRFLIKTRHREIIVTDDHPILIKNENNEYHYKNINEINKKYDTLVLPSIDENNEFIVQMDNDDYYVGLNDIGKEKVQKIESIGIINKIKSLNLKSSYKNIHSFLKGNNRKIKYSDYIILMNEFNLNLEYIDIFYSKNSIPAIVDKNCNYKLTKDFYRFFGFMLGDGWISENGNVGFALGVYEDENNYYIKLAKELSKNKNSIITCRKDTKSCSFTLYSNEFANIIKKFGFITGFNNKRIPKDIFNISIENKYEFIKGIFDADGCDNSNVYSSSNYELIKDLQLLAKTINIKVGRKISIDKRLYTNFNGNVIQKNESYKLYINLNSFNYDQILFQKITDIIKLDSGNVWDIEVDNKYHNFIAEGLVVHNCIMAEDAMLSYRILRAGEKRVFKIDVGNLDVNDIESYIQKVATKFKRSPQINRDNGNIDHRFNILGNDEDYFIPVRNSNAGTVIDTLPGGESLDKIADIEYLRDNLFTSLGVPKPFLGYQNTAGEGKNLAQQDMRFSKKVNRVQQSIIQELNKIAIIHLYLLGFEDELDNFSLSLSSPSNQAEILKVELLTLKMQLYNELTQTQDNGIAAASHTWAKKNILNWSEDEIVKDLENQMMERIVIQELQNATNLFAKTGIFDNIINKYGTKEGEIPISAPGEEDKMEDGGEFANLGGETDSSNQETGGEIPAMPEMGESRRFKNNKLIMEIMKSNVDENKSKLLEEYKTTQDKSNQLFNKTLESIKEIDKNLEK
jgi:intein/homing endonuclease